MSQLFGSRVFERGESYWRDGRVKGVTQIAPNVFHGEVRGGSLYDVTIRVHGRGDARGYGWSDATAADSASLSLSAGLSTADWTIQSCSCTCLSAVSGHYCKHCSAVLLAIVHGTSDEQAHHPDDAVPSAWETGAGGTIPDSSPVSSAPPARMLTSTQTAMPALPPTTTSTDDPGPIPHGTYQAVRSYCSSWYGDHGPLLVWDPQVIDECEAMQRMSFPCLSLQQAGRMTESVVQSYLDFRDDDDDWDDDDWDDDRWDDDEFDESDWSDGAGAMATFAVSRAVLSDDFGRVRELALRHMRAVPEASVWRASETLPEATFPYRWVTVLIASAQRLGDRVELEHLYRRIIAHGGKTMSWYDDEVLEEDKACVDGLRTLVGGLQWRERTLPAIIEKCETQDDANRICENRIYEYLLQSEHLDEQMLEYCSRVPDAIDRLYDSVAASQPVRATTLLLEPYAGDRAFVGTVSRAEYRKVADRLRRAIPFMGAAWVAAYARSLSAKYPRRINLKAALKGLM